MKHHGLRPIVLLAVLLLAGSPPALADSTAGAAESLRDSERSRGATAASTPILLAESWSIGKFVSGANSRTRIVQICVAVMCIALFIMMRKLQ